MPRLCPQIRALWAAAALTGPSLACYDGAFLDLACDRQGTCPASTTDESSGASTAPTTDTSDTDTSTTEAPEPGLHAYRITQLTLTDPHFYFTVAGTCTDVTNFLQPALTDELNKGTLNLILLFDDADPSAAAVRVDFTEGACVVGTGKTSCSFKPGEVYSPIEVPNFADAPCDAIVPGTTNPLYVPPNTPGPICFATPRTDFVLPMLGSALPALALRDSLIAARYATDAPVNDLIQGVLSGYLSAAEAAAINSEVTGIPFNLWATIAGSETNCMPLSPIDGVTPIDDTDPDPDPTMLTRGVWFYLNFTASRVEWIE